MSWGFKASCSGPMTVAMYEPRDSECMGDEQPDMDCTNEALMCTDKAYKSLKRVQCYAAPAFMSNSRCLILFILRG